MNPPSPSRERDPRMRNDAATSLDSQCLPPRPPSSPWPCLGASASALASSFQREPGISRRAAAAGPSWRPESQVKLPALPTAVDFPARLSSALYDLRCTR